MKKYHIFIFVTFVIMLFIQLTDAPTFLDDLVYHFVWKSDFDFSSSWPIKDFSDLLTSQLEHFKGNNGRWLIHTLAQVFLCFLPPAVYQVISAILFVVMIDLGARFITPKDKFFGAVVLCFGIFIVLRGVGTAMMWSMGTFNYLWSITATLALLLYMRRKDVKWYYSPLALLAGCCHESLSLPIATTFLIYIYFHRKDIVRNPLLPFMLFYMVGAATCLATPAIWNRAGGSSDMTLRIINGCVNLVLNMRILWLLSLTLLWLYFKNRLLLHACLRTYRYLFICLLLEVGIVVVCGERHDRVGFLADFTALMICIPIWSHLLNLRWRNLATTALCVIMALMALPVLAVRWDNLQSYHTMEQQLAENDDDEPISVPIPPKNENKLCRLLRQRYVAPYIKFGFYEPYMAFNANDTTLHLFATLHGKEKVYFMPSDVVDRIAADSNAYRNPELDASGAIYVWRVRDNALADSVIFDLKDEDMDTLTISQRMVAYHGNTYSYSNHHRNIIIKIHGGHYLVFPRPTTNVYRRIKRIRYKSNADSVNTNDSPKVYLPDDDKT